MRNFRLIVAAVVGIPLAIIGAFMAVTEYFSGTGTVHVVAPVASTLTVRVDGEERATLAAGAHQELELEQGERQIELVRGDGAPQTLTLDVDDGFYEGLVPAEGQCFVELDGTEAYYGSAPRPDVEARYFGGQPFDIGSQRYFDDRALPSQISDGSHIYLVFEVPCAMQQASDRELLVAAGYDR